MPPTIHTDPTPANSRMIRSVSEQDLLDLVKKQVDQQDRQQARLIASIAKLNDTFEREMNGLRRQMWVVVILALMLGAARDGVFTRIGLPGVTLETHTSVDQQNGP